MPPAAAGLLREAVRAISLDQLGAAERLLDQALRLAPDNPEVHRLRGIAALMAGAHDRAIQHLRNALIHRPGDARITMTLGNALIESGANEEGLTHLEEACRLAPENAETWYNIGVAHELMSHLQDARNAFERAVAIAPEYLKARNKLATVMIILGDTAEAARTLRETLRRQPDCAEAWFVLGNLKTELLGSDDIAQLENLLQRPDLSGDTRVLLAFTLAKALEDQSDYAASFDMVSEANRLKRRTLYWSREEERNRVNAIAEAFSGPLPEPVDASFGREVIFLVHLPRSGSTLTEQILASHPQINGGDELYTLPGILDEESDRRGKAFPQWVSEATSADWRRLGEVYLDRTRHVRDQHPRFTDKTPNNWAFVGAALAMLPGSRIVNVRRDPLETCFSCYRQLFLVGCDYTYDLDDMVDYYSGYERLGQLWQQRFPQRYLEFSYELLQTDTESQVRRLLDFCQLPFDPACLDFHQTRRNVLTLSASQVRQPLRRDTARSAAYGDKLDPLRAKLREAGLGSR